MLKDHFGVVDIPFLYWIVNALGTIGGRSSRVRLIKNKVEEIIKWNVWFGGIVSVFIGIRRLFSTVMYRADAMSEYSPFWLI